jgi:hypothetical protein
MKNSQRVIATALLVGISTIASAQNLSEDATTVLNEVKEQNKDMKAFCQSGEPAMRKAVMDTMMSLMQQQKIKGNPMAIGQETGGALRAECSKLR